jgi:hypothetical protein
MKSSPQPSKKPAIGYSKASQPYNQNFLLTAQLSQLPNTSINKVAKPAPANKKKAKKKKK